MHVLLRRLRETSHLTPARGYKNTLKGFSSLQGMPANAGNNLGRSFTAGEDVIQNRGDKLLARVEAARQGCCSTFLIVLNGGTGCPSVRASTLPHIPPILDDMSSCETPPDIIAGAGTPGHGRNSKEHVRTTSTKLCKALESTYVGIP